MIYLYIVQDGEGNINNYYWDRKDTRGVEQVINMFSTRTPMEDKEGWIKSNKDAVILNIIDIDYKEDV